MFLNYKIDYFLRSLCEVRIIKRECGTIDRNQPNHTEGIAFTLNLFLSVSNVASEFFNHFHHETDILGADLESVTKVNRTIPDGPSAKNSNFIKTGLEIEV